MYAREDALGWQQSNDFKAAFSIDVDIEFVGVFDTVASVGLIPREMVIIVFSYASCCCFLIICISHSRNRTVISSTSGKNDRISVVRA